MTIATTNPKGTNMFKKFLITLSLAAGLSLAPSVAFAAEEVGDTYAFAVQGHDCGTPDAVPGYIQINGVVGADWHVGGSNFGEVATTTQYPQPGGFQDDLFVTPRDGYTIAQNRMGSEAHPLYMTVDPCVKTEAPVTHTEDQYQVLRELVGELSDHVAQLAATVHRLEQKVVNQQATIDRLRDRNARLRHRLHHR